jgi:Uncharacterised nucleotidyltransferase
MKTAEIERLLTDYGRTSAENKIRFEKLTALLRQMQKAGIDCVLLKGADLIPRLYGVLGVRPLGDADLLVHESDLSAIDHLLTRLGYRPLIDGNPAYLDPDKILALDIVTNVWYVDDQEAIWRRAASRDFGGITVKGMGAGDLLIYLTAYSVLHRGWFSASFARDIALVLEKEKVEWDWVVDEASRYRLRIPMYHALSRVLTSHARVPIPEQVLRRLAPSTAVERLWHRLLEKLVTDEPLVELGHLLLFVTRPGSRKWRWLKDVLFPSPAFLRYRYGGEGAAHPLRTRVKRGLYLALRAQLLLTRVASRLVKRR